MRHIDKNDTPVFFQDFLRRDRPSSWEDLHKAEPPVYKDICLALLEEQDNVCGYTELPLKTDHMHIDHYHKRALFPEMCFCWDNFIMATMDDDFGARYKDYQINNMETYDEIFNPVTEHPEDYFEYNYLGEIKPKQGLPEMLTNKAVKTIDIFNLNATKLKDKRRNSIIAYNALKKGGLPVQEIIENIKPGGFISLINQLCG